MNFLSGLAGIWHSNGSRVSKAFFVPSVTYCNFYPSKSRPMSIDRWLFEVTYNTRYSFMETRLLEDFVSYRRNLLCTDRSLLRDYRMPSKSSSSPGLSCFDPGKRLSCFSTKIIARYNFWRQRQFSKAIRSNILRGGNVITKVRLPKGSLQLFFASQSRRKAWLAEVDRSV